MEIAVKETDDVPTELLEDRRTRKARAFEPVSKFCNSVVASFELSPASKPFELEEIDTYA